MFKNEPLTDFSNQKNIDAVLSALETFEVKRISPPGIISAPIINGKEIKTSQTEQSLDPSDQRISIGTVHYSDISHAETALSVARAFHSTWDATPVKTRAEILRKTAKIIRDNKHDWNALIIREAGKTFGEADGETAEAIDFCEYYAEEAEKMTAFLTMEIPGEENTYFYQSRGVAVVISPWNFPFAISLGMVVASLVTGNTVIFKPSEQTSIIGSELIKLLYEAGIPHQALHFLPGIGETLGAHLVKSKDVDLICFTGSKDVGLWIIKEAGETKPGQANVKKVIAEMGGKNAIIIDENIDHDSAVKGVLASAFGFAGQKCSACSRLIIVGNQYESFLQKLSAACLSLIGGKAFLPASYISPVIDRESQTRLFKKIEEAKKDVKVLCEGEKLSEEICYVPPVIFRDTPKDHFLMKDELFGPVIAATNVSSFDEALNVANDTNYALTGGLYSIDETHLERAKREYKVGNLYLNRKITGAFVKRQPFGGFKMSGVGSKAGGKDYLLQFVEPRTVSMAV